MTTLQQYCVNCNVSNNEEDRLPSTPYINNSSSKKCKYITDEDTVTSIVDHTEEEQERLVATHRRSLTLVSYSRDTDNSYGKIDLFRNTTTRVKDIHCHSHKSLMPWNQVGTFVIPRLVSGGEQRFICALPFECYNSIAVLISTPKGAVLIFIDLYGRLITKITLLNVSNVIAADVDQNRKEMIVACADGVLVSYAIRLVKAQEIIVDRNKERVTKPHDEWAVLDGVFQAINRKTGRVPSEGGHHAVQILTQDVGGQSLILTNKYHIICIDSSVFTLLWIVSKDCFARKPVHLFVDKFGSDFLVLCEEVSESGSKRTLEYWTVPKTYALSDANRFERAVIPLSGNLVAASIESVNKYLGTSIIVATSNRHVQLWSIGEPEGVRLEADLILSGQVGTFDQSKLDERISSPFYSSGLASFVGSVHAFQCPVSVICTSGMDMVLIEVHTPTIDDIAYHKKLLDVMLDQYQVRQNVSASFRNVEDIDFVTRFSLHQTKLKPPLIHRIVPEKKKREPKILNMESAKVDIEGHNLDMQSISSQVSELTISKVDISLPTLRGQPYLGRDDNTLNSHTMPVSFGHPSISTFDDELPSEDCQANNGLPFHMNRKSALGMTIDSRSIDARQPCKPSALLFLPLNTISGFKSEIPSDTFQVVVQPSAAVFSFSLSSATVDFNQTIAAQNTIDSKSFKHFTATQLITRKGLYPTISPPSDFKTSSLDISLCSIAFRSSLLSVLTSFKEGYVYNLKPQSNHDFAPPLRLEFNIRKDASATTMLMADVYLKLIQNESKSCSTKPNVIVGEHSLCFVGDNDGVLNYALFTKGIVLQTNTLKAHNSPIIAVLATGDANRPIWRIAGVPGRSKTDPLTLNNLPGSAIITGSSDGEFKVWQPFFKCATYNARARDVNVLSMYEIEWKVCGVFTAKEKNENSATVTKACLDPTCMVVIICFSNGVIQQWQIPGLIDSESVGLSTCMQYLSTNMVHVSGMTDIRIFVHPSISEVSEIDPKDIDDEQLQIGSTKYICVRGSKKYAIAYTMFDLKRLVALSSLTTSSFDKSVTLWSFAIVPTNNKQDRSGSVQAYFLKINAVKRFTFSNVPYGGICFSLSDPLDQKSMWYLNMISNGIVFTASHGERKDLFLPHFNLEVEGLADFSVGIGKLSSRRVSIDLMPCIGDIRKPGRVVDLGNTRAPIGTDNSWSLFEAWVLRNDDFDCNTTPIPPAYVQGDTKGFISAMNIEVDPHVPEKVLRELEISPDGKKKLYHEGIRMTIDERDVENTIVNFSPSKFVAASSKIGSTLLAGELSTLKHDFINDLLQHNKKEADATTPSRPSSVFTDAEGEDQDEPGFNDEGKINVQRSEKLPIAMTSKVGKKIKLTKSTLLKGMKALKDKERNDIKSKAALVQYTSKSRVDKVFDESFSCKQPLVGAAIIGVPKIFNEEKIKTVTARVVVGEKIDDKTPLTMSVDACDSQIINIAPPLVQVAPVKKTTILGVALEKVGDNEWLGIHATSLFAEVPTYFDRSAKPIIYKKSKPVKKYTPKRPFDDDITLASTLANSSMSQGDVEDFAVMLGTMTKAEKDMFDNFDDAEKVAILSQMREEILSSTEAQAAMMRMADVDDGMSVDKSSGGQSKSVGLLKLKAVMSIGKGKGGLMKILGERKVKPEVKIRVVEATETSITFSLQSPYDGKCTVLLVSVDTIVDHPIIVDMFHGDNHEEIIRESIHPEYLSHFKLDEDETQSVVVSELRPENVYYIYAYMECHGENNGRPFCTMTNDDLMSTKLEVKTKDECLDLEWGRLTNEMQSIEVKAASQCVAVQRAAARQTPPIIFPTDAEIAGRNDISKENKSVVKKWTDFIFWWTNDDSVLGYSQSRSEFLFAEAVCACKEATIREAFKREGYIDQDAYAKLSKLVSTVSLNVLDEIGGPLDDVNFRRFRSWYKAGQSVLDKMRRSKEDLIIKYKERRVQLEELGQPVTASSDMTEDLVQQRLERRRDYLLQRMKSVNLCKSRVAVLIEGTKEAEKRGLSEKDLQVRRGELTMQEVDIIMQSLKLKQLCSDGGFVKQKLDVRLIESGKISIQALSGADIFGICDTSLTQPDDGPVPDMPCIPGTNRKPLKPWLLMTEEEKNLEVGLACMMDSIFEMAIMDGVSVPDPEDITVDPKIYFFRLQKFKLFTTWYAGKEATARTPAEAVPSLARTTFSELWESNMINFDPFVKNTIRKVTLPGLQKRRHPVVREKLDLEDEDDDSDSDDDDDASKSTVDTKNTEKSSAQIILPNAIRKSAVGGRPSMVNVIRKVSGTSVKSVASVVAEKRKLSSMMKAKSANNLEGQSELVKMYTNSINSQMMMKMRFSLLRKCIDVITLSRRLCMLKIVCPPGSARLSQIFAFPKMGVIIPLFDLPLTRYKLYPSRINDSWTKSEILSWYTQDDLDDEDRAMIRASEYAKKRAAYLEWLAHESERVDECRLSLLEEDKQSHVSREYWNNVERKLNIKPFGDYGHTDFAFAVPKSLPGEYSFINRETSRFIHGTGIDNEDELDDIKEEQKLEAEKAREAERKFLRDLEEAQRQRQAEELARIKRAEQDKRLLDNIERRRQVRERFDDLKRQKRIEAMEEERLDSERAMEEILLLESLKDEKIKKEKRNRLEKERIEELSFMTREEAYMRDYMLRSRATFSMEHEDILSMLRENLDSQTTEHEQKKDLFLSKVFQPHEEFKFNIDRIKLPALHTSLSTEAFDLENYLIGRDLAQHRDLGQHSTMKLSQTWDPLRALRPIHKPEISDEFLAQLKIRNYIDLMHKQRKLTLSSLSALTNQNVSLSNKPRNVKVKRIDIDLRNKHTVPVVNDMARRDLLELAAEGEEIVMQFQNDRDRIKNYMTSEAVLQDNFYLKTIEPGVRSKDSLENNSLAMKYRDSLDSKANIWGGHNETGGSEELSLKSKDIENEQYEMYGEKRNWNDVDPGSKKKRVKLKATLDKPSVKIIALNRNSDPFREMDLNPPFYPVYSKPFGIKGKELHIKDLHPMHNVVMKGKIAKSVKAATKETVIAKRDRDVSNSDAVSRVSDLSKEDELFQEMSEEVLSPGNQTRLLLPFSDSLVGASLLCASSSFTPSSSSRLGGSRILPERGTSPPQSPPWSPALDITLTAAKLKINPHPLSRQISPGHVSNSDGVEFEVGDDIERCVGEDLDDQVSAGSSHLGISRVSITSNRTRDMVTDE